MIASSHDDLGAVIFLLIGSMTILTFAAGWSVLWLFRLIQHGTVRPREKRRALLVIPLMLGVCLGGFSAYLCMKMVTAEPFDQSMLSFIAVMVSLPAVTTILRVVFYISLEHAEDEKQRP